MHLYVDGIRPASLNSSQPPRIFRADDDEMHWHRASSSRRSARRRAEAVGDFRRGQVAKRAFGGFAYFFPGV